MKTIYFVRSGFNPARSMHYSSSSYQLPEGTDRPKAIAGAQKMWCNHHIAENSQITAIEVRVGEDGRIAAISVSDVWITGYGDRDRDALCRIPNPTWSHVGSYEIDHPDDPTVNPWELKIGEAFVPPSLGGEEEDAA